MAYSAIAIGACFAPRAARAQFDPWLVQDFDELWRTLSERYCFFEDKAVDWDRVRAVYRPQVEAVGNRDDFASIVRNVLAELYDAHTHLNQEWNGAPRWPPFDVRVEVDGSAAVVTDVMSGSSAEANGILAGDRIVAVEGVPVLEAAQQFMPNCLSRPDPEAEIYALNVAVSGRRGAARRFEITRGGRGLMIDLPTTGGGSGPDLALERLDGGVGRITITSFGSADTIEAYDRALETLQDTSGLIIDVRGNGGGDTAVARPIMGRFITERMPYAAMRRRQGPGLSEPWLEYVDPRGPFTYERPVVVLTDAWSASMAEGFPMGMRAIGRGRIVGRPMMGLGAAVFQLRLDRSGLELQYSAEPVYTPQGHPRWRIRPDVETEPGRDILQAGLTELHRIIAPDS